MGLILLLLSLVMVVQLQISFGYKFMPLRILSRTFSLRSTDDDNRREIVGAGGIEEGGFYSIGPRSHVPSIHEKAVVVLPKPYEVERGYSDKKAAEKRKLIGYKEGPFTQEEDDLIRKLVASDPGGRGRWVRIAKELGRHEQHVLYRWTQVLETEKRVFKDIVFDSQSVKRNA